MPGTVGFDTTVSFSAGDRASTDNHFAMTVLGTYTAGAADQVSEFGFNTHSGAVNFGSIEIGLVRTDTLAMVASATVTSTTVGRYTTTITPVALVNGVEYGVCWRTISASVGVGQQSLGVDVGIRNTSLTGADALADPFVDNGSAIQTEFSIFAIVEAAGGGGSSIIKSSLNLLGVGG